MDSRVILNPLYNSRIKALHDTKIIENAKKLSHTDSGYYDTDDHGYIYFDDFKFIPEYNDEGIVNGCLLIGKNFKRFLEQHPVYIHPSSALAGCWAGLFGSFAKFGLRSEDKTPEYLSEIHKKYGITQPGIGGMNHLGPDMKIGLDLGWNGLLEKIRYYRNHNNPTNTEFYDGEELLILGVLEYIKNHVKYARNMADQTTDSIIKENYSQIADDNEFLLKNPPKTFRQACQFLAHFQVIDRIYFAGGALSQLDELLRPYYENDAKSNILTDEQTIWILASLFYNDTHYSQIGGRTPDGTRDLSSRLSFLILDAMHELKIPINNGIRVYDGMNEKLLNRGIEYILKDGSGVCFSLSKGIEEGYARNGYPIQLARMRAKVGCNWVALPGIEYPLQDVTRLNLANTLIHAFEDIKKSENPTMELLWDNFCRHLLIMINCIKDGYDHQLEVISRNLPEIVLNLFCHGPIERGLNAAEGGVDIINLNLDAAALATVADSFAAIEQRVVNEKRISWQKLYEVLDNDYENEENIRLMMKNIPRFGSPDSIALKWAVKIRDFFVENVKSSSTPKKHIMLIPGLFSHGDILNYGKNIPATPNGRKKGEAISHSSEPDPGFSSGSTSFSPTLKANAVAAVQPGYGNSAPLHLDIDMDFLSSDNTVSIISALIHSHEQAGGTLINLNLLDKETILKAHEDPSLYPDLIVRVTGYSAFFSSLSKKYRQQIVDRFLTK